MNLRQAAQQALEAMEDAMYRADTHEFYEAKEALRAALAEPETVMHQYKYQAYGYYKEDGKLKLGTIPEPQTTHWEGCEAVHPECRKPEQKPVAWMSNKDFNPIRIRIMSEAYDLADRGDSEGYNAIKVMCGDVQRMLPPQRKPVPLTDEQIALIVGECAASAHRHDDFSFARAIERAHGIGEQT